MDDPSNGAQKLLLLKDKYSNPSMQVMSFSQERERAGWEKKK